MNRRLLLILLFCLLLPALYAQIDHEDILTIEYGGLWQNDEYLSPLLYDGQFLSLRNDWNQHFRRDSLWTHRGSVSILGGRMYSERKLNSMYALEAQASWTAYYNFADKIGWKGFNLYLGPSVNFDLMVREHTSNVNKPISLDLSLTANARAGISYSFKGKKTSYRVLYEIETSLIGTMFAPDYWQSYYEITERPKGIMVFASVHNRQLLNHQLCFDMQFPHSAWRIGIRHEYMQYNAHNLHFSREEVSIVLGTIFHFKSSIQAF